MAERQFFAGGLSWSQAVKSMIRFKIIVNVDVMSGEAKEALIGFKAAEFAGVDF